MPGIVTDIKSTGTRQERSVPPVTPALGTWVKTAALLGENPQLKKILQPAGCFTLVATLWEADVSSTTLLTTTIVNFCFRALIPAFLYDSPDPCPAPAAHFLEPSAHSPLSPCSREPTSNPTSSSTTATSGPLTKNSRARKPWRSARAESSRSVPTTKCSPWQPQTPANMTWGGKPCSPDSTMPTATPSTPA